MSGASMNTIKARMKSVKSTMQITKAMELVATSKLRRARINADNAKAFCEVLDKTVRQLLCSKTVNETESVWFGNEEASDRVLYVVIAGDRGLAGGYNANVFRMTEALSNGKNAIYLPIGKKALELYRHRGKDILSVDYGEVADLGVGDCLKLASSICEQFLSGGFCEVEIIYTEFVSMISQVPIHKTLLPLDPLDNDAEGVKDVIFDGEISDILDKSVPQYIGTLLYAAVSEAVASESGARRTAMNSANKNASEMIDSLTLNYNRARQAVITQEITEIVSGSESL